MMMMSRGSVDIEWNSGLTLSALWTEICTIMRTWLLLGWGGGVPEVTGCEPSCLVTRNRVHVRITLITDYMDLGVQATADRDTFLTGG